MSLVVLGSLVAGLVLLVLGAEVLVQGASRLAGRLGIPPLIVGLTVVAFGTSAPELAVSVQAGLDGQAGIALGNVVGSNIFNVLVVLGLAALITPLAVQAPLVRLDLPLMLAASALLWVLALDGRISVWEGSLLVAGILAYTGYAVVQGRRGGEAAAPPPVRGLAARLPVQIAQVLLGLVLLVLGATWLVDGAVAVARGLGVSETVIGLTIVAAGTSLPELATSMLAAWRGERDIAVGNVVGSNLFNILGIAGIAALVTPGGLTVVESLLRFDLPVMLAVALLCLPVFLTGRRIERWEGALFLGIYLGYLGYLVLQATAPDALPPYRDALLGFVLPLTALAAFVAWVGGRRRV